MRVSAHQIYARIRAAVRRASTCRPVISGMVVGLAVIITVAATATHAQIGFGSNPVASTTSSVNLQSGLAGQWKFDGNARDASPNGNNGTTTSTTLVADRKGTASSAYSFNGTSSRIIVANDTILNMYQYQWTISLWMNSTQSGTTSYLVGKRNAGPSDAYYVQMLGSGVIRAGVGNSSIVTLDGAKVVNDGNWHNIVVRFSRSGSMSIYVDGQADGSVSISSQNSVISNSVALVFGRDSYASGNFYAGSLDDIRIYRRTINISEVAALYDGYNPTLKAASGSKGLVGQWKLDGNARDSSPYGNNGAIAGATLSADRKGTAGSAYGFVGASSQQISISDSVPLSPTAAITISCWFNGTVSGGLAGIISKDIGGGGATNPPYSFEVNGSTLTFRITSGLDYTKLVTRTSLSDNTWYHAVGTFDGANMSLYVNGALAGTTTQANVADSTGAFRIGQQKSGFGRFFTGAVDDVRVYSRALLADEIKAQYDQYNSGLQAGGSGQAGSVNLGKGLIGSWGFDGNIRDATPFAYNGTFQGAPAAVVDRKGRASSAYETAVSKSVTLPAMPNLGNVFSISSWVYPTQINSGRTIFGGVDSGGGLYMKLSDGMPGLYRISGSLGVTVGSSGTVLPTNAWSHVAATYDASGNWAIYINGALSASGNNVQTFSSTGYAIGRRSTSSEYFVGSLDDVRVWNRALNAAEVKALAESY